jgi:hypothetical protein
VTHGTPPAVHIRELKSHAEPSMQAYGILLLLGPICRLACGFATTKLRSSLLSRLSEVRMWPQNPQESNQAEIHGYKSVIDVTQPLLSSIQRDIFPAPRQSLQHLETIQNMTVLNFLSILLAAALFQFSRASHSDFDVAIKTHNVPDSPDADTHLALRQSLTSIAKREDQIDLFKINTTLQQSWENAVLLLSV